jgi:hypothetical protein
VKKVITIVGSGKGAFAVHTKDREVFVWGDESEVSADWLIGIDKLRPQHEY